MLELFLGQIPEAIYFALFMIYAKNLKTKRLLYTILMILEYVLLKSFLHYNLWFQVLYTFLSYVILKILYKEKAQITDIFTFMIGSLLLIAICALAYFPIYWIKPNFILSAILVKIILFTVLFSINHRFYKIQSLYKKFWNRNDKLPKRMKSITFRCINLIIFNLMFYLINIAILFVIWGNGGA